jgi:hypothetical protein
MLQHRGRRRRRRLPNLGVMIDDLGREAQDAQVWIHLDFTPSNG